MPISNDTVRSVDPSLFSFVKGNATKLVGAVTSYVKEHPLYDDFKDVMGVFNPGGTEVYKVLSSFGNFFARNWKSIISGAQGSDDAFDGMVRLAVDSVDSSDKTEFDFDANEMLREFAKADQANKAHSRVIEMFQSVREDFEEGRYGDFAFKCYALAERYRKEDVDG